MNDAILPPNQQEGRNLKCGQKNLLCVAAKDRPKRMQSRAVKTHKWTHRRSGKQQCGWSELSSRVAKILAAQNKKFSDSSEKYGVCTMLAITRDCTCEAAARLSPLVRRDRATTWPQLDDFAALLLQVDGAAT
jgi:hypothetical protein